MFEKLVRHALIGIIKVITYKMVEFEEIIGSNQDFSWCMSMWISSQNTSHQVYTLLYLSPTANVFFFFWVLNYLVCLFSFSKRSWDMNISMSNEHGHELAPITRGTLKSPPHKLLEMSDPGGGSPPAKNLPPPGIFLNSNENSCPPRPTSKKNIALAFLKAIWLQIPYWVHFKISNPICTST